MEALIAAGADPHAVSELGFNAFHAAIDVNGEANAEESVRATLSLLRRLGVDLERRNHVGHTPLACAIACGTEIEVRVLTEIGADPNASCPLYRCGEDACEHVDEPLIFHAIDPATTTPDEKLAALLRAGARLDVTDRDGLTPLERAEEILREEREDDDDTVKPGDSGAERCVRLLREARERERE